MTDERSGLSSGMVIGGYELDRRIGKGGMAEVWVARRTTSRAGKFVAVKAILPHLAGQERYSRMFQKEAELSSMLSHSNIVQVFDEGEDNGLSYLVMEFVDGINLVRLREALRLIDDVEARESIIAHVIGQLLHALSYAHAITNHEGEELGIVHRDVSPQNVLISNSGDVKLADFGVAHTVIEESSGVHIKGKLRYMAPEQLGGRTKEPGLDLYAVGGILHELLEGVKFRGEFDDDRMLYSQILSGAIPNLRSPCSPELEQLRVGLLAGDPAQRLQTADDALALLSGFRGYRDMRLEVSKICSSLTGVMRPRTGPGQRGRPPTNPRQPAGRGSAPAVAVAPAAAGVAKAPASSPMQAPAVSGPVGAAVPVASAVPAYAPATPSPAASAGLAPPAAGGSPGAPVEPTAFVDSGPQGAYASGPAPVPVPTEQTAYLDPNAGSLGAPPSEPTAYLDSGPHLPEAVPEATDTENRPRPTTIPDRLVAPDIEPSTTRFAIEKRSSAMVITMVVIGVVLALGGAVATGFVLAGGSDDEPESTAVQSAAKDNDAPAPPPKAAPPVAEPPPPDEPALVIPETTAPPAPEAEAEKTAVAADKAPEAEAPADAPTPVADADREPPAPAEEPAAPESAADRKPADSGSGRDRGTRKPGAAAKPRSKVLVHFRKKGVEQAWVKFAGKTVEITKGRSREIRSGRYRLSKRLTDGGAWKRCGTHNFKPHQEWILYVSASSCKLESLGG